MEPPTPARRAVVYAHFDAEGVVREFVPHCLRELKKIGRPLLVTTTAPLRAGERDKILGVADRLIEVPNIGYDFYSWKMGLAELAGQWDQLDEIVLMNSSVVGPLFSLTPLFEAMRSQPADFWGVTDSYELGYHLQSYFLVFRRRLLQSAAFRDYWAEMKPVADRQQVIFQYETQITKHFRGKGFRSGVFFPCNRVVHPLQRWLSRKKRKVNVTMRYPAEVVRAGGPFIKIQLLRENPCRINLDDLLEEVRERTPHGRSLLQTLPASMRAGLTGV